MKHTSITPKEKILIISYYFSPINSAGVYRISGFSRHLPELGWKPIVLTLRDPERFEIVDQGLEMPNVQLIRVPYFALYRPNRNPQEGFKTIRQGDRSKEGQSHRGFRTFALNSLKRVRRWFAQVYRKNIYYNQGQRIGWIIPAIYYAYRTIKREKCRIVLTSSPPHFIHLIGLILRKISKIKWVADFRDPWMDLKSCQNLPAWQRFINSRLEERIVSLADLIIANTPTNRTDLLSRYPNIAERVSVIPNGYDIKPQTKSERLPGSANPIIMAYTGEIYPGMADSFFETLRNLKRKEPNLARYLRIKIAGIISPPDLHKIIEYQLEDLFEYLGFVSYQTSNKITSEANILLFLVPPTMPGWVPSKLYNYLASGNYIFAIVPPGDAAEIIKHTHSGICFEHNNTEGIGHALLDLVFRFKNGWTPERVDEDLLKEYSRERLTQRLDKLCRLLLA